ncbi:MAG TPA: ornithine cyclodeaminase family protein [Solirubrobacterales bacterium]|nr:ornithine cyclodeaminase family protein [Solirubrobacterales bacterium]
MTLILDNEDVLAAAEMSAVIAALEDAMRIEAAGGVETVPRVNLPIAPKGFFRVMPAVIDSLDLMGLKVFNTSRSSEVRYLIGLWSIESGELKALVDACHLTAIRTGAVTAMAHRAIAGDRVAEEIGIIGSGLEARTNLEAICCVAEIRRARVFSPNPERRERFAAEMSARLGIEVLPVATPAEAADCPAVLAATNTGIGSGRIALESEWVRPAGHVDSIGSTMPALRELGAELFGRADLIVLDTLDSIEESGDLIAARESGNWEDSRVRTLASLFAADAPPPRPSADSLTIFKSVGTALQDLIAADAIFRVAAEQGRGREVDFLYGKEFVA